MVERLHSTKGPHDLAHFFIVHSLGAIIQLVPEQLMDLLFPLESLKTVILICTSVFLQCDIAPLLSKITWKIYIMSYRCYLLAENEDFNVWEFVISHYKNIFLITLTSFCSTKLVNTVKNSFVSKSYKIDTFSLKKIQELLKIKY